MTHYLIYLNGEPLQCFGDPAFSEYVGEHFYSPLFRDREIAEKVLAEAPGIYDMDMDLAKALRIVPVEI